MAVLPDIAPWWRLQFPIGSRPEWLVHWSLIKLGWEGRFQAQVSYMGGRMDRGGAIVDFDIPELNLVIAVQGNYWHDSLEQRGQDAVIRAQLESLGKTVIYILEDHALEDPIFYTSEALKLRSHVS